MPGPTYVLNADPQYFSVSYYDDGNPAKRAALEAKWKYFDRPDPSTGQTYKVWYRQTNPNLEVTVDHRMPVNCQAGRYRIEVFVPGRHATTRRAIFTVATNFRVENNQMIHDEPVSVIDMYDLYDVWQPLGEFDLDPAGQPESGRVRQYDISLEDPPVEASYSPVRWIPLFTQHVVVRFDSPLGTQAERDGPFATGATFYKKYPVWDGEWFDYNPFLSWYVYGYHTGADLNLPGLGPVDKGKPVYAISDGNVVYAGKAGTWGRIVVIEHADALVTLPSGVQRRQPVYSRYGHVDTIQVQAGQAVSRGQYICNIGLPAGQTAGWHLHFDVSYTDLLKKHPAHWPDLNKAKASIMKEVVNNYLEPLRFIKDNHG